MKKQMARNLLFYLLSVMIIKEFDIFTLPISKIPSSFAGLADLKKNDDDEKKSGRR